MSPATIRVVAILLLIVAALAGGYGLHRVIAERDAYAAQATAQGAHIDDLRAARDQDHANSQSAAQVEQQRIDNAAKRDTHFDKLQQDIDEHAKDPGRDRGNADPEFVRIWREANAGSAHP